MEPGGEPSESEPTFTPPGSLPRATELPVEEPQLADLDFGQTLPDGTTEELPVRTREQWADQRDVPETDLLGLGEEEGGAAIGAPIAVDPVARDPVLTATHAAAAAAVAAGPELQGPNEYHWLHGEIPPQATEPDAVVEDPIQQPQQVKEETTGEEGAAPGALESTEEAAKKEEEHQTSWSEDPTLPVDSFLEGEVDYDPDIPEEEEPIEEQPVPGEGAAASSSAPAEVPVEVPAEQEEGDQGEEFQPVRRRGTRGGGDVRKKNFKKNFHQVGVPAAKAWLQQYTRFNCGYTFRLDTPYLIPKIQTFLHL